MASRFLDSTRCFYRLCFALDTAGTGNYGESFERNVGQGSPLKIERGLNKLWNKGGVQYAPPIR